MAGTNQGGIQGIFKLSTRPQQEVVNRHDLSMALEPDGLSTRVYIGECTNCQMTLDKKAANILIENCKDLVLTMSAQLVSGTLEIAKSSNILVKISPNIKIPTVTADSTTGLKIIMLENEDQIENLYFHRSSNLLLVQGEGLERKEYIALPPSNAPEDLQFISFWEKGENGIELKTEKVVREGVFPKSEGEFLKAKERDRKNAEMAFNFLESQIKIAMKK